MTRRPIPRGPLVPTATLAKRHVAMILATLLYVRNELPLRSRHRLKIAEAIKAFKRSFNV